MITVIGVRFKKAGKVYYFDPCDVWPRPGASVVVETARGIELGEVVTGARQVADDQIVLPLRKVIRAALEEDIEHAEQNARKEKEAFPICQERIRAHKLDMKLVDVEYTFDNSKIIFYFIADGRVDFRELVKDLASIFKMRIELRQIGVRDEAKMLGGLGACGRKVCCAAFLGDFQPLSIKMAKEQNLSLNPVKISGQCGRLMCCLRYEEDNYEQTLKRAPRVGMDVITPDGPGVVTDVFVIREKVRVRFHNPDDTYDMRDFNIDDVYRPGRKPVRREEEAAVEQPQKPCETAAPEEPEMTAEADNAAEPAAEQQPERERRRSPRGRSGRRTGNRPDDRKTNDVPAEAQPAAEPVQPEPRKEMPVDPDFESLEESAPPERKPGAHRHRRGGHGHRKPQQPPQE